MKKKPINGSPSQEFYIVSKEDLKNSVHHWRTVHSMRHYI